VYLAYDLNEFCTLVGTTLHFTNMPPSFSCVVRTRANDEQKKQVRELERAQIPDNLFSLTNLPALNHLLFKCESEERDISQ